MTMGIVVYSAHDCEKKIEIFENKADAFKKAIEIQNNYLKKHNAEDDFSIRRIEEANLIELEVMGESTTMYCKIDII